MRLLWLQTLLLAAIISLPLDGLAAPCPQKRCPTQNLVTRGAEAGIIPILPIPKPIVPVIRPWPIAPKPIKPKPITPKPVKPAPPPKPLEPAQPNPGAGPRCKRAPGDACANITPFSDAELEGARLKGRDAQATLLATQRATPARQDVERTAVSTKYNHQDEKDQKPPMDEEEIEFLGQSQLQVSYTSDPVWTQATTRNQAGVNPKLDNIILDTSTSSKDRGIVISDSRNKENDLAAGEDKVPWSDMVMFDLTRAFRDAEMKPSELQYMIRSNIMSGSSASKTQGYIEEAIKRIKGNRSRVNTFRSDPAAPGILPDEVAAYQLLAGSDHVHRVLLMLNDYPSTMKNVRVESLSVTTPATEGAEEVYNIVIKFTKLDAP